jgi:nucleoside-diphosphate-sugar epimerase
VSRLERATAPRPVRWEMVAERRRVLVTGASGFVGWRTCGVLAGSGYVVRAVVRGGREVPPGVERVQLDSLNDRVGLIHATEGVHAVVHLAALTHSPTAAREEYWRTNVDGSHALLEAAVTGGVRRFVFLSSVKAVSEQSDAVLTEETPPRPRDAYGESKLVAERLVLEKNGAGGLETTVLRIPMAYGPGMKGNILTLFRLIEAGVPLPVGSVRNRRSIVYVDNVAFALAELLFSQATPGEVFFCADPRSLSTAELVREIALALGRRARVVPAPVHLLKIASRLADRMGSAVRSRLGSAALDRLVGSLEVDTAKLSRIGFTPPFTTPEGMKAAARWYLSRGSSSSTPD